MTKKQFLWLAMMPIIVAVCVTHAQGSINPGNNQQQRYEIQFSTMPDRRGLPHGGGIDGSEPGTLLITIVPDSANDSFPQTLAPGSPGQVDAWGCIRDSCIHGLLSNSIDLLVSFEGDPNGGAVWYETGGGRRGMLWTHTDFDASAIEGSFDVDAFNEIDGPYNPVCSFQEGTMTGDCELWESVYPIVEQDTLGYVLRQLGWNGSSTNDLDIDAIIFLDTNSVIGQLNPGTEMLFSIRATDNFSGGEIIYWKVGDDERGIHHTISFLQHGGHAWDTSFNVAEVFGVNTMEVDALDGLDSPHHASHLSALSGHGLAVAISLLLIFGCWAIIRKTKMAASSTSVGR